MSSRARDLPTFIHSKVMIVDDALVRVGSANTNHRSMGVDTECDLAVEAAGHAETCAGILGIRDRLLAEHLGIPVEAVAPAIARAGSLRAVVDAHDGAEHGLVRLQLGPADGAEPSETVRAAVDPDEPMALGTSLERLVPPLDPATGRVPLRIWVVPSAVLVTAVVAALIASASGRSELQSVQQAIDVTRHAPLSAVIGVGVFLVAGFVLIPLELLVIVAGVCFGALRGGLVALIGSLAAAVVGYGAGRLIGPAAVGRWMSRRSYRSVRQLGAQGITGIAVLRLTTVASAGAIHLLCGASRVPFAGYMAGTMMGLGPAILALGGFGALVGDTLLHPSLSGAALTVAAGLVVAAAAIGLRTLLLIRQFAPSFFRHRERAEFG